ncbi:hypothetical protein DCC81_08050 [Chitinophaga parva]|uniref:Uncharacterized protein n=1 Tax=Chitinophaga parva TaxID=2169414 RepID=A0A2T7BP15_9BACT|nr:hypothetical protein DCC81_08050 [Chitinophaga parva]
MKLKNGKEITIFYKKNHEITYTVSLTFRNNMFKLHSYYLDGNNVLSEENYKDESLIEVSDFNQFIDLIIAKFPGIEATI